MAKSGFLNGSQSMKSPKHSSKGNKMANKPALDTLPKPGSKPIKVKKATTKYKLNGVKDSSAKGK